jgi:hypothetical protein
MKISKRLLKRIIKEEAAALGMGMEAPLPSAPMAAAPMTESEAPEAELVMEMDVALMGLETVMESLDSAAGICQDCLPEVAAQGPVLQAVASQVSALKETLAAVGEVVAENVEGPAAVAPAAAAALPEETIAMIQAEARRQRRRRR